MIFCSDTYLLEINRKFLEHNYFTDIITFPFEDDQKISGDLFISVERVEENSKILETREIDELHRVIAHGLLHLCGYNDKSKQEVQMMRNKEMEWLQLREEPLLREQKLR